MPFTLPQSITSTAPVNMFLFKHGSRRAVQAIQTHATQRFASNISIPFQPPPIPIIEKCPSPTCQCRESPPGLDIEREQNINGSMAAYAEQVLISTGRDDWKSRIEDEEDAVLVNQLKKNLTRGGKFVDPYHNILITNSSFPPTPSRRSTPNPGKDPSSTSTADSASAFLLPSFQYIPSIPTTNPTSIEAFIKAFLLPQKLHNAHARLTRAEQNILLREAELQAQFPGARDIDEILILICGHGGRDDRCGKLGPVLREEFHEKLQRQNIPLSHSPPPLEAEIVDTAFEGYVPTARVGLISHIGGHKWAGNVIVYIPPSFERNSLTGKGIWYGRVGPEHVEGIVAKTVLEGKVIKELFRGGIDRGGEIIRL